MMQAAQRWVIRNKAPRFAAPLLFAATAVALGLGGCAADYGPSINGQRALSPEEMRLQAVETKLADVSRRMNGLEAAQQGSTSGDEVRALRGQVEQLRHDLEQAQLKNQAQYDDTDGRLKKFESGAVAAGTPPAAPGPDESGNMTAAQTPVVAAPVAPTTSSTPANASASADEEAIYLRNFDAVRGGRYDEAIGGFRGQLSKYPQGNYADNAWYWMGESYYNFKHDNTNALKSYQSLLQSFPASPKVPDALLKTGMIYQDQQKKDQARAAYAQVVKSYPSSTAAAQAKTRLAQLK